MAPAMHCAGEELRDERSGLMHGQKKVHRQELREHNWERPR